jgi:DNA-binding beta-propeller fold protein YncE
MLVPVLKRERFSVLAACAAALVLAACSGPLQGSSPAPGHGQHVTIPTSIDPVGVAFTPGFAWVANAGDGTVWKVDVNTYKVVDKVFIGSSTGFVGQQVNGAGIPGCETGSIHQTPHGDFRIRNCDLPKAVAASRGSVWTGKGDTRSLVRIDPKSGRVMDTISVGVEPWYIVATDTAVWLSDWRTNTVVRVDPVTGRVVATISNLPAGTTGLALSPGALWVTSSRDAMLTRIDTTTNEVVASLHTDQTPLPVVYAFGSVWVRNEFEEGTGTVQRIDPATNQVVATIPGITPVAGRDGLDGMAVLDGGVWVAGLELQKIDPATNRVVRMINHTCGAVTADGTSLWAVDIAYSVTRIWP